MEKITREAKSEVEKRSFSPFGTRMAKTGPETDAGGSSPGRDSSLGRDYNTCFSSVMSIHMIFLEALEFYIRR